MKALIIMAGCGAFLYWLHLNAGTLSPQTTVPAITAGNDGTRSTIVATGPATPVASGGGGDIRPAAGDGRLIDNFDRFGGYGGDLLFSGDGGGEPTYRDQFPAAPGVIDVSGPGPHESGPGTHGAGTRET